MIRWKNILCFALLIAVLMSLGACKKNTAEANYPTGYEQLSAMIGMTKEEVCTQLGLSSEQLIEQATGLYAIPSTAELAGIPFEIQLCFDVGNADKLYGIWYQAVYEGNIEQAMQNAVTLAKQFSTRYGDTINAAYMDVSTVISSWDVEERINTLPTHEPLDCTNTWDITADAGAQVRTFMEDDHYKDYEMQFVLGLRFVANSTADMAAIQLTYQTQGF